MKQKSATTDIASAAAVVFAFPITLGYFIAVCGFVAMKLWNWHMADLAGATVQWHHGAAAYLLVRLLTPTTVGTPDDGKELSDKVTRLVGLAIAPWLSLLVGWLVL